VIVLIDNYDSFTYNLVQYLGELGAEVKVVRNDQIGVADIVACEPDALVLSPGPCAPDQAGVSLSAVRSLSGTLPILGVCLGHQCIGQAFGGRIVRAARVMHGKCSPVEHDGTGLFTGVAPRAEAGRYHSLVIERATLPESLVATAFSADDHEVMAVRHRAHPTVGVQFHPESLLTEWGKTVLANFLGGRLC
jgi:anthranilate synthase/aminodeoxychorismate synthase-like glutamine amidotransferase